MFKYLLYAAVMLIAYSVSGCSSTVYHLYVEDHQKIYNMGVEYVKAEEGGIEVNTAFIEYYDNMYVFDMTITNFTNSSIRVEPELFYFMKVDTAGNFQDKSKIFAYDPELKIIEYDKLRETKFNANLTHVEYEEAKARQEIEKKLWKDDALRKIDLNPGEYVRGNVYFPVKKSAEKLKLHIPIAGRAIILIYNQQKY